ncbi:chloride channel protein [Microbulbifer sp. ANSA003]|uniref:chloride channel protein n=1 Tax=unclassified Microbulbifer TaxID=2619833 RepID=UPI0039B565C9
MSQPPRNSLKKSFSRYLVRPGSLENIRLQLSSKDALAPLLGMALITGILAGGVTVLFRLAMEWPTTLFLSIPQNYESLPPFWRFALPVIGSLVVGCIYLFLNPRRRQVGVVHVLDRLYNHQGQMPMQNALLQFFAGAIILISGHSVGREGPAVHLGAASGSWLARALKLPNNSGRNLLGCGVAAAIAASFNTPLAGVVFAMEVVMLEYTVAGFLPIILAAVAGSAITQLTFGSQPDFNVPAIQLNSLAELPLLFVCALVIGVLAGLFIRSQRILIPQQRYSPLLRFLLVGLVTGTLGIWVPEILGGGYDTLQMAMLGELGVATLIAIVAAKLVATALGAGLGIPGGVIGPSLIIGACIGGIAGGLANLWLGEHTASPGFYAMVGMAAMMAAMLNAPLAALLAILELTYNPHILFPGMMMIVVATLVSRQLFSTIGLYHETLRALNKAGMPSWRQQMLSSVGVASEMNQSFVVTPREITRAAATELINQHPEWILIDLPKEPAPQLLRAADLATFLRGGAKEAAESEKQASSASDKLLDPGEMIDLLRLPGERKQLASLSWRATMLEASQKLERSGADGLYVCRHKSGSLDNRTAGIILPLQINNFYRK